MIIHASCYSAFFLGRHQRALLVEKEQIAAIIAGFAFLSVTISALVIRPIWYELFYVVHICFFIVGIVCACFHQPDFGKEIIIILLLTAAMWFTDRVIRAARALYYLPNNYATVHPLPNGGTKIVMKKVPTRADGGKHFFVWIPRIRAFEMHPFTVVGTQPLEFIVKSHDGFTRDLHKYAAAHPGATLRASVDGPYGTFPDPIHYDKIVLIAGGGGASFTFGLAVNALERMKEGSNTEVVFIWTVKQHGRFAHCNAVPADPALTPPPRQPSLVHPAPRNPQNSQRPRHSQHQPIRDPRPRLTTRPHPAPTHRRAGHRPPRPRPHGNHVQHLRLLGSQLLARVPGRHRRGKIPGQGEIHHPPSHPRSADNAVLRDREGDGAARQRRHRGRRQRDGRHADVGHRRQPAGAAHGFRLGEEAEEAAPHDGRAAGRGDVDQGGGEGRTAESEGARCELWAAELDDYCAEYDGESGAG